MAMKLHSLGEFVALTQGLAINAGTAHLVSNTKSDKFSLPLLRIADMIDNHYEKYISKDVQRSVIAYPSDIIYTRTGQIGLAFTGKMGVVHNNSFIVKLISDELCPDYLYVMLKSDFVREQALGFAKNSVQPDLTHDMFKSVKIPVPTKAVQRRIANIYLRLEKKIQINNSINDNLQQMVKAYFDFHFARQTPNDKLFQIVDEHEKSSVQVGESEGIVGQYPFFTSGEAVNEWETSMVDGINCFLATGGNATIKVYSGKASYSTDTWCISGKGDYSAYLYYYLKSIINSINTSYFAGSGLKHLQKEGLLLLDLYLPSHDELAAFNKVAIPTLNQCAELFRETKLLEKQRNFLLPLLMNGQATVAE